MASLLLALVWLSFETSFALAQVTTAIAPTAGAGSLGTTVTASGHTVQITGGTRLGNGTNLFHSFDQFNVGRPDTAQFLNTTPSLHTFNILGRVTGGNPSSIFGTIDTMSYPGANLFLMNPAGIVFGPNATLHVGGSVAFTTANYLRLAEADGSHAGIFHAETTSTNLLTSASVAAFGFLGANPAAIAVQGSTLNVPPGQSISLVGGDYGFTSTNPSTGTTTSLPNGVTMTGAKLLPPGGQVHIASVASPGEILAGTLDQAANINGQSFGALGTIQISQQSTIDISDKGGGTILIRGGRLVIDNSTISASTGDISLDATSIQITGVDTQIQTGTTTAATAGHILLKASGNIDLDSKAGVFSGSDGSSSNGSSGDAGNITISSSQGDVNFTNGASVTSQTFASSGNTGSIGINAPHGDILLAGSTVFNSVSQGTGTLGSIRINAHNLQLRDRSAIGGDNAGPSVAGNIAITLDGQLTLAGRSFINTGAPGPADSADLTIRAHDILIADGSELTSSTSSPGAGGAINLSAQSLTIQNGGTISAETHGTTSHATGGSITVNTTDHVTMTGGASITADSTGPGNAGTITINAGQQLDLMGNSSVKTDAPKASGGNINIQAIDHVRVVNSKINASAPGGDGSGGNITIDPNVIVLQHSDVTANAVKGAGGNITFITPLFLADSSSTVSAISQFGVNGRVTIQSPTSNLSGSLGTLPSEPSQAHSLLTQRCAALVNGQTSSFVVAGREQLPADPGGWLTSPLTFATLGENLDAGHAIAAAPATMPIAAHGTGTVSLRRLTPAGFLMANFADSETTGCHS